MKWNKNSTVLCQTISKPHSQNSATNSMIMKDGIGTSTECPSEVVYLLENSFIHLEEAKRLFWWPTLGKNIALVLFKPSNRSTFWRRVWVFWLLLSTQTWNRKFNTYVQLLCYRILLVLNSAFGRYKIPENVTARKFTSAVKVLSSTYGRHPNY